MVAALLKVTQFWYHVLFKYNNLHSVYLKKEDELDIGRLREMDFVCANWDD